MSLLIACWRVSQLMRHHFLVRWICPLFDLHHFGIKHYWQIRVNHQSFFFMDFFDNPFALCCDFSRLPWTIEFTRSRLSPLRSILYIYVVNLLYRTGSLKIDNDFVLRQAQWRSFGTRPVKNASFEMKTSHKCFLNNYNIKFQDM